MPMLRVVDSAAHAAALWRNTFAYDVIACHAVALTPVHADLRRAAMSLYVLPCRHCAAVDY